MKLSDYVAKLKHIQVHSVTVDTHISDIYEVMRVSDVRYLAVLRAGDFVGLIDQMSLLNGIMLSPQHFNSLEAKDIMKTSVPILDESHTLDDLLHSMKSRKVVAVPYYEAGELKYLFSQEDLVLMLEGIFNEHQEGLFTDAEAKSELFMANPIVQKIMATLSDVGI